PRETCTQNSHYDVLDLTDLPEDYLPRTNYIPACDHACDHAEYQRRIPRVSRIEEGENAPKKVTEYFRLCYRGMLSQSGERTLISTLIPKGAAHIHGVQSTSFKNATVCLNQAVISSSVIGDFYVKTTGRSNLMAAWSSFPY